MNFLTQKPEYGTIFAESNPLTPNILYRIKRLRTAWFVFIAVLFSTRAVSGFGQNVDSLYHLYSEARGDRRIVLVNEMAQAVYTLECIDTLFRVEQNVKPELVDAVVYELMSSFAVYSLNDLAKAVNFSLNAAKLYEQADDMRAMDLNYSNAAVYYFRMGEYEKSIDLMLKCYEFAKQTNDPEALSTTLNSLGVAYSNFGNHEMAIEYFRQAVEIERPLNRPTQYAGRLGTLAKENAILGNYDEALRLIKEAIASAEKIERKEREERIAVHQRTMGDIYAQMDSLPQAEQCYLSSISVFELNNRQQLLSETLLDLGRLQVRQHRFAAAIETLKRCVVISGENNLLPTLRDAYHFLYEAYKQNGYAMQALLYLEQYRDLNDSIFRETTQRQLSEFQVKYETAEKELEIERQQSEISRHRARQNMFIAGLSAAALLLVLLIYNVRIRIRRNRELAQNNVVKDKFFSIISHDLKTPADAQRFGLKLLVDNVEKWDTQATADYSRNLLKSAEGLVELLKNLLNWSHIHTGRRVFQPFPVNLVTALQPDIDIVKNMAGRKNITLETQMPPSAVVTADENMINTVVRNLLANAVKFTPEGGTVTLEIAKASPNPSKGGGFSPPSGELEGAFTVSVSDTGIGMTKEQQQIIFRLDRQQSREGTAGEQGTGLGLIVCKEMLEKHGSQLYIESEAGKGSRFWFTI